MTQVFPEMRNSSNYCRNGGGIEHTPWCYTMDPLVRWQHCHIEKCGEWFDSCKKYKVYPEALRVCLVSYLPATIAIVVLSSNQYTLSLENLTEINYKVELDIVEERTTIIDEILTPTFIALAASVAAATVIVILLIALICHRFNHDDDDQMTIMIVIMMFMAWFMTHP